MGEGLEHRSIGHNRDKGKSLGPT
jgi:hypothetical protein